SRRSNQPGTHPSRTLVMTLEFAPRPRPAFFLISGLALILGLGWASREIAWALEPAKAVPSQTVVVDGVAMKDDSLLNQPAGTIGVYVSGETPSSSQFVTGRFVLDPGKTPHTPHTHIEEEVMIIESGRGDIFCDGKTTQVGPGSVMYTTPNAPHGIVNTG